MDLITKAVEEVLFRIPREILKLAYAEPFEYNRVNPTTLEEMILRKTVRARVLKDANIVGGDEVVIDVENISPQVFDDNILIFEIPGKLVNHREILSVLSANYATLGLIPNSPLPGYVAGRDAGRNDLMMAGMQMMDSRSSMPIVSTSNCEVVGHNIIKITAVRVYSSIKSIRCIVANDSRLQNLSIRNSPMFSELVTHAVKSYIYTTLNVKLDRGAIEAGQELPSIKAYVEGLSDADENYRTYLRETWSGVAFLADRESFSNLMRLQVSAAF